MQSTATSPEEYSNSLPDERKKAVGMLREVILQNLPAGFTETMAYGMIAYVVPHSVYPAGYHVDPAQPLPFINLASQKNYIALYHMGLYSNQKLLQWFQEAYARETKTKLDIGKSCIRFKKIDAIPYGLIGDLVSKISVEEYIRAYEASRPA